MGCPSLTLCYNRSRVVLVKPSIVSDFIHFGSQLVNDVGTSVLFVQESPDGLPVGPFPVCFGI